MTALRLACVAVLIVLPGGAIGQTPPENKTAEKPPYRRLLQGDDAKQVADLAKRIVGKEAADQYGEAVAAAERLLALRRHVQGTDHYEVVSQNWEVERLRKLAALPADGRQVWRQTVARAEQAQRLCSAGSYREALPLRREAAETVARLLGEGHPEAAACYDGLASCLQSLGRSADAQPFYQKALEINSRALGERHPDTARSLNGLAYCLQAQWKSAEALPFFQKSLEVCQHTLGEATLTLPRATTTWPAASRLRESWPKHFPCTGSRWTSAGRPWARAMLTLP